MPKHGLVRREANVGSSLKLRRRRRAGARLVDNGLVGLADRLIRFNAPALYAVVMALCALVFGNSWILNMRRTCIYQGW